MYHHLIVLIRLGSCSRTTSQALVYNETFDDLDTERKEGKVRTDLEERGLLYKKAYTANIVRKNSSGTRTQPSRHFFSISTNSTKVGDPFSFRVAVDVEDTPSATNKYTGAVKYVKAWECGLNAADAELTAYSIMNQVNVSYFMLEWGAPMAGASWPGMNAEKAYPDETLASTFAFYMNAAFMVSGARELVQQENDDSLEYSVLRLATIAPYWVIALCVSLFLWVCALLSYLFYLSWTCRALRTEYDSNLSQYHVSAREVIDHTPVGLLEWMQRAPYESRNLHKVPQSGELKDWILNTTWHGQRLGIVRRSEHGQVDVRNQDPSTPMFDDSLSGIMPLTASSKGQYTSVNIKEIHQ